MQVNQDREDIASWSSVIRDILTGGQLNLKVFWTRTIKKHKHERVVICIRGKGRVMLPLLPFQYWFEQKVFHYSFSAVSQNKETRRMQPVFVVEETVPYRTIFRWTNAPGIRNRVFRTKVQKISEPFLNSKRFSTATRRFSRIASNFVKILFGIGSIGIEPITF